MAPRHGAAIPARPSSPDPHTRQCRPAAAGPATGALLATPEQSPEAALAALEKEAADFAALLRRRHWPSMREAKAELKQREHARSHAALQLDPRCRAHCHAQIKPACYTSYTRSCGGGAADARCRCGGGVAAAMCRGGSGAAAAMGRRGGAIAVSGMGRAGSGTAAAMSHGGSGVAVVMCRSGATAVNAMDRAGSSTTAAMCRGGGGAAAAMCHARSCGGGGANAEWRTGQLCAWWPTIWQALHTTLSALELAAAAMRRFGCAVRPSPARSAAPAKRFFCLRPGPFHPGTVAGATVTSSLGTFSSNGRRTPRPRYISCSVLTRYAR